MTVVLALVLAAAYFVLNVVIGAIVSRVRFGWFWIFKISATMTGAALIVFALIATIAALTGTWEVVLA